MRSYLIVANQTLTSQSLTQAIRARLTEGPIAPMWSCRSPRSVGG